MLPTRDAAAARLADVAASSVAAMRAESNVLRLPPVRGAIVLVVDGLGAANLQQRAGHARTLAGAPGKAIVSGFPSTTAVALTSLTTGAMPGSHGVVGYDALVPGTGVRNQLREWGGAMDPATWQRARTLFEQVPSIAIGEPKFSDSGFTRAALRGAEYRGGRTVAERFALAREAARAPALVYLYVPELDRIGHDEGWQSGRWTAALETLDGEIRALAEALPRDTGMLVTADHGMVDVDAARHRLVPPVLLDGVAAVAGEPRALQLHREPGLEDAAWARVVEAWRATYGDIAWISTRGEIATAGWLGELDPEVAPRFGDLVVAARAQTAFYLDEHDAGRGMVGQHGSFTPEELRVPLKRFGAFA